MFLHTHVCVMKSMGGGGGGMHTHRIYSTCCEYRSVRLSKAWSGEARCTLSLLCKECQIIKQEACFLWLCFC